MARQFYLWTFVLLAWPLLLVNCSEDDDAGLVTGPSYSQVDVDASSVTGPSYSEVYDDASPVAEPSYSEDDAKPVTGPSYFPREDLRQDLDILRKELVEYVHATVDSLGHRLSGGRDRIANVLHQMEPRFYTKHHQPEAYPDNPGGFTPFMNAWHGMSSYFGGEHEEETVGEPRHLEGDVHRPNSRGPEILSRKRRFLPNPIEALSRLFTGDEYRPNIPYVLLPTFQTGTPLTFNSAGAVPHSNGFVNDANVVPAYGDNGIVGRGPAYPGLSSGGLPYVGRY